MDRKTLLELERFCGEQSSLMFALYELSCRGRNSYSVAVYSKRIGCAYAEDVTDNKQAAERFLELLRQEGADPCHLCDLLEDALPLK